MKNTLMKKRIVSVMAAAVMSVSSAAGAFGTELANTVSTANAAGSVDVGTLDFSVRQAGNAVYASPNGSGDGSSQSSPTSVANAVKKVTAGGTVYLLAGTYKLSDTLTIKSDNKGTSSAYKNMRPVDNAKVVFDFSNEALGQRGINLEGEYWHLYGFDICNAGDNGLYLSGNNNIVEMLTLHNNQDTGLQVSQSSGNWPSNNLIKNCTSYDNCDDATMENADGFAAKLTCGGGNVFDGCISYNNSDDGWDLYAKPETGPIGVVTIKNCVAFRNGFTTDGRGWGDCDGNGFKLGGGGVGTRHIVQNCLAFENLHCGFTDNNNPEFGDMTNCTAYNNDIGGEGKANYMVYRCSSSAKIKGCVSYYNQSNMSSINVKGNSGNCTKHGSDKWKGSLSDSLSYKGSSLNYISSTSASGGEVSGTSASLSDSGFKSVKAPSMSTNFHTAWRNSDGSINLGGFGDTTGTYGNIGSHLSSGSSSSTPVVTTTAMSSTPAVTTTKASSSSTPSTGGYDHDFTASGLSSSFYTISGNLSTSKGTVSYNGKTLTQCLKMETATSISFNAGSSGTLTLVFAEPTATAKINGTKYTASNGIITATVNAGTNTITKADSCNLFYMSFSGTGSAAPTTTVAPTTTAKPSTTGGNSQPATTTQSGGSQQVYTGDIKLVSAGGWNEMAWLEVSGIKDSDVSGVSYSGATSGTLTGNDLKYLVRDTSKGVRVDITGLKAGTYSITLNTSKGIVTKSNISVTAQDRSGYAHYNYTSGVGAYNDDGTLKANAVVLYVDNNNKDTVSVTSKDGTTVTGIGNILNSSGKDSGNGKTTNGGTANSNSGIIEKLAKDGTPLVVRIVGTVKQPKGVTEYNTVNYGGSVGDNGGMCRMQSGKDITIEGIGTDAVIDGWGLHFIAQSGSPTLGKSFEVRNIAFKNVPEDCIGMEGVQEGSTLTASVERCWIHNNEFYVPSISNPAESDKAQGDGACDFKRGQYFTNSYNYYEGYHKTNLVGASDSNLQFNITFHHNYWNKCESRGPLARQANIHMYNNVFEGQTSYCQNPRANAYIFSEYNLFSNSKNPGTLKSGGVIKSYKDTFSNCKGDMNATVVSSKTEKVSNSCQISDFDTNSSKSYIPSGDYKLDTDTSKLLSAFEKDGGCMDEMNLSAGDLTTGGTVEAPATTTTTAIPTTTTTTAAPTTTTTTAPETTTTTTSAPATTTTVPEGEESGILGDANNDGIVSVADATLIMQFLANPNGFKLTSSNQADCAGSSDGVTSEDALAIQKYISGKDVTFTK